MRRRALLAGLAAGPGWAATGQVLAQARRAPPRAGVRVDVATMDPARLRVIEAAIGTMQRRSARDRDDPAGWDAHTTMHARVCGSAQPDGPRVHGTWWFLPWHRAYLAVTERKLQAIAGDDTLRLPYWDWCADGRIPAAFGRAHSPFSAARRFGPPRTLRAAEVGLAPSGRMPALLAPEFAPTSLAEVSAAFGGVDDEHPLGWRGRSRMEGVPHAAIHNFVGGEAGDGTLGDMAKLSTAARDPLFLLHHANLDRLWETWRADPAHRATEPRTAAFLDRTFSFIGLDGLPLVIPMRDLLSTETLRYGYDRLGTPGRAVADRPTDAPALVSATLAWPGQVGGRVDLVVHVQTASPRPINAEIVVAPAAEPAASVVVGAISVAASRSAPVFPDTDWRFDVTDLAARLGAMLVASIVPLDLARSRFGSYDWGASLALEAAERTITARPAPG